MSRPLRLACSLIVMLAVALAAAACSDPDDGATTTTTGPPPPPSTTTTEAPIEAGEQVFVYQPSVGDCFDRRKLEPEPDQRGQTDIVLLLDCALPHQYETFAVLDVPGAGPEFPGEEALEDLAKANCVTGFEAFVGRPYVVSELEVGWYLPTESAWGQGARTIACYVYALDDERLTGTVAGSQR